MQVADPKRRHYLVPRPPDVVRQGRRGLQPGHLEGGRRCAAAHRSDQQRVHQYVPPPPRLESRLTSHFSGLGGICLLRCARRVLARQAPCRSWKGMR